MVRQPKRALLHKNVEMIEKEVHSNSGQLPQKLSLLNKDAPTYSCLPCSSCLVTLLRAVSGIPLLGRYQKPSPIKGGMVTPLTTYRATV